MAIRDNREYRAMPLLMPAAQNKRFNSDYYVEGFATTFDSPYVLASCDGVDYKELISRDALNDADLSDVIFLYNHRGQVYARNHMGSNKPTTLLLEPQDSGFFIAADLGSTTESKNMFEQIDSGLISQMSWAFTVTDDEYDAETHTRTIHRIGKVYDVSAVSLPANPDTVINSRDYFNGVIEAEKAERLEREKQLKLLKLKLEV